MKLAHLSERGSVALITVLVISSILIAIVIAMSEAHISTAYLYTNSNSDKEAYYSAEACLEEAIVRLESDTSFSGETVTITEISTDCVISVSGGGTKTVDITVNAPNYTQYYRANVQIVDVGSVHNATLLNWREI